MITKLPSLKVTRLFLLDLESSFSVAHRETAMKTVTLLIVGIIVSMLYYYSFSSDHSTDMKAVPAEQPGTSLYYFDSTNHRNLKGENVDLFTWHQQYRERCYLQDRENSLNKNVKTVKKILTFLNKDPGFEKYFSNILKELNPALCLDDRADGTRGYYDFKYNVIAVREHLEFLEKLVIFVHEIRHVDHIMKGFNYSLDYSMEEIVRMIFAIEADVQAIVTLFAWRMKDHGYADLWNTLSKFERYADISDSFEEEMLESGNELNAAKAAFSQWYKSEWRVDCYFKSTCSIYFDLLDETKKIRKYSKFPKHYFDDLCTLPSGKNYACHLTNEILQIPRITIKKVKENNHLILE